jgi:DNA-binding PadR family transcriptional regulator
MAPNRTTFAILGFLTLGPMSGYDIKKMVEGSIDNFWSESFGQIYPALRRLTEQGLIDKRKETSAGGRPRHVYSILEPGRAALQDWLRAPTDPAPVRVELLLKLFFGAHSDRETNRRQILRYRDQMSRDLERYGAITKLLRSREGTAGDLPYWLLTLRFGERDRQAHIEWCDEALELLDRLPTDERAEAQGGELRERA